MPHLLRRAGWLALLVGLGACGGGGGGGGGEDPKPEDPPPPGITGTILLADAELGRIAEQEPNDSRAQAYRLAPIGPRCRLEVAGIVGQTAAWSGVVDPVDVFRLEPLVDQEVDLTLTFPELDPVGGGANDLEIEVWDVATDSLLTALRDGVPPRSTSFSATGGATYDIVIRCVAGHASYLLTLRTLDPAGGAATEALVGKTTPAAAVAERSDCAGTHVLVRLREGADEHALAGRFGLELGRRTGLGTLRMRFPRALAREGRGERIAAWCARLAADDAVRSVEPDWIVQPQAEPTEPDDADYARQWNLRVVGAPGAWAVTQGDPSIVVGVVDTGIVDHPDLAGQVVAGYDFISDRSIAGDGSERDPDPTDVGARDRPSGLSSWHGTHVAAIVAARVNDGAGVCGLAPGCRVMPLRAVGIGGGLVSDVADAILYAAGLFTTEDGHSLGTPLRIVNLSFALGQDTQELRSACARAANVGVLLVGTTGNNGERVLYPAKYDSVLAIAAVDRRLDTTGYSNFGDEVSLSAPGGLRTADFTGAGWLDSVPSAVLDDTVHPIAPSLGYLEGTSQAAPHVAAAAALLLSVDPTLSTTDLKNYLQWSALDRGQAGWDDAYGWGVLQAHGALRLLLDDMETPSTEPPCLWLDAQSILFRGFDDRHEIVVMNVGGGRLEFSEPIVETDDGGDWLSAENVPALGSGPTAVARIAVLVDPRVVPALPGRHSGTVFVRDDAGDVIGTIRVVGVIGDYLRAGRDLTVRVERAGSGQQVGLDVASPAHGYRFWFPEVGSGSFLIRAGTDLDGDGFFCEDSDHCGWYGGATEAEAQTISIGSSDTFRNADIRLFPPED